MQRRVDQVRRFRFDPTKGVDPREIQKADSELVQRRNEIERELHLVRARLENLTKPARDDIIAAASPWDELACTAAKAKADLDSFSKVYP